MNNMDVENFDKFLQIDPDTGTTYTFIGASGSGKSYALMHMLKKYFIPNYDVIIFCCLATDSTVYKGLDKINKVIWISNPKHMFDFYLAIKEICSVTHNKFKWLLVFDDVIDQRYNKYMQELFLVARNFNISSVISVQYHTLIAKAQRGSFRYIFIFSPRTSEALEACCKSIAGDFLPGNKVDDKKKILEYLTEDHRFVAIDYIHDIVLLCKLNIQKKNIEIKFDNKIMHELKIANK